MPSSSAASSTSSCAGTGAPFRRSHVSGSRPCSSCRTILAPLFFRRLSGLGDSTEANTACLSSGTLWTSVRIISRAMLSGLRCITAPMLIWRFAGRHSGEQGSKLSTARNATFSFLDRVFSSTTVTLASVGALSASVRRTSSVALSSSVPHRSSSSSSVIGKTRSTMPPGQGAYAK